MKFINFHEVSATVGFGRTHIYTEIKKGTFPAPHKIGKKASRWLESDIFEWMRCQIEGAAKPIVIAK